MAGLPWGARSPPGHRADWLAQARGSSDANRLSRTTSRCGDRRAAVLSACRAFPLLAETRAASPGLEGPGRPRPDCEPGQTAAVPAGTSQMCAHLQPVQLSAQCPTGKSVLGATLGEPPQIGLALKLGRRCKLERWEGGAGPQPQTPAVMK